MVHDHTGWRENPHCITQHDVVKDGYWVGKTSIVRNCAYFGGGNGFGGGGENDDGEGEGERKETKTVGNTQSANWWCEMNALILLL